MRIKSKTFQDTFSSTPGWCSCSDGWWHFPEPQLCVGGRWAPAAAQAWCGSSKRKVQEESNQPCKRNPALLCLAKCCKILDKPGLVAFFLSNSVLRFPELRQQPEQALCTLKCTSLENSTFSPFGLQFLMLRQLCVTEVRIPCAELWLLLRLLRRTEKPQHGSSHSLLPFTTPSCQHNLLSQCFFNSFKPNKAA